MHIGISIIAQSLVPFVANYFNWPAHIQKEICDVKTAVRNRGRVYIVLYDCRL